MFEEAPDNSQKDQKQTAQELLLPLGRGLTANWKLGNRREAGAALTHVVGSGEEANQVVASMSRVFKKVRYNRSSGENIG